MDKRIYKYPLEITDRQTLMVHTILEALTVDVCRQTNELCLWAMVDASSDKEPMKIEIIGTGNFIPDLSIIEDKEVSSATLKESRTFIGTVQQPPFVWHVFRIDHVIAPFTEWD